MPITNATAPPMRTASTSSGSKRASAPTQSTVNKDRAEALAGLGQLAQVPLIATKQYADVGALSMYWPNVAKELANLADSQEQIAKFIDPLIQIGPYTGLITALLPLVMQVGVNHGIMAPGGMGTVPASTLSAQVETSMAEQELQALQVQLQAEKAAHALRSEIAESRKAMQQAMSEVRGESGD
jgi:hypothetical protein